MKIEKVKGIKKPLKGILEMPGDKSISHRAVILGALAEGVTKINGFLNGEDCLNTIKIFQQMGVSIKQNGKNLLVKGVGLRGLKKPNTALNVGNSGTSFRLLLGVLAGQNFITKLTGDASIHKRPMDRVVLPLRQMGAKFSGDKAPIIVFPPAKSLRGISYTMPVASAQVKSAILLAGLYAKEKTTIVESHPTRDHTERMLENFGVKLLKKGSAVELPSGDKKIKASSVTVPGDISAAAFFIAAAAIVPQSMLTIKNVCINESRTGFLQALQKMGSKITFKNKKTVSGEPVADIVVQYAPLKATEFSGALVANMIDEIPILSIVASFAAGKTVIKDAQELRVKESDRIASIIEMLGKFGVKAEETKDGLIIHGETQRKISKKVNINSYHDHRIAMSALIMGLCNDKETTVGDTACIATSFPEFISSIKKATK